MALECGDFGDSIKLEVWEFGSSLGELHLVNQWPEDRTEHAVAYTVLGFGW